MKRIRLLGRVTGCALVLTSIPTGTAFALHSPDSVGNDKPASATTRSSGDEAPPPPPSAPSEIPPEPPNHSVASLKLQVVELGLARNDASRFCGAVQVAPYNSATQFLVGFQLGLTNTAGEHPWSNGRTLALMKRSATEPPDAFAGVGQFGLVNAVDGNFTGGTQIGALSMVNGAFRGLAQIGIVGSVAGEGSTTAVQVSGLFGSAVDITGIQVAAFMTNAKRVRGLQIGAGHVVFGPFKGMQLGLVNANLTNEKTRRREPDPPPIPTDGVQLGVGNLAGALRGVELGAFNVAANSADGVQASMVNYASRLHGVQLGAVNVAANAADGVQVGLINGASRVNGLQIGVINYASHLNGLQIGALNIAPDAEVPFLPAVNASFD